MAEEMSLANHAKRRRINEEEESSKESADADQPAPEGAQAPEEEEPLAMLARVRGERTDLLAARAAATALAGISEGAAADAGAGADRHDLALSLRLDPGPAHDQRGDIYGSDAASGCPRLARVLPERLARSTWTADDSLRD